MKILHLTIAVMLVGISALVGDVAVARDGRPDPKKLAAARQKLKNAAFCSCLRHSFPPDFLVSDGSLAGYIETGAHDLEAFEVVDRAAAVAAKKEYPSKHEHPLSVMKCLDFYNSAELESLVNLLDDRVLPGR